MAGRDPSALEVMAVSAQRGKIDGLRSVFVDLAKPEDRAKLSPLELAAAEERRRKLAALAEAAFEAAGIISPSTKQVQ